MAAQLQQLLLSSALTLPAGCTLLVVEVHLASTSAREVLLVDSTHSVTSSQRRSSTQTTIDPTPKQSPATAPMASVALHSHGATRRSVQSRAAVELPVDLPHRLALRLPCRAPRRAACWLASLRQPCDKKRKLPRLHRRCTAPSAADSSTSNGQLAWVSWRSTSLSQCSHPRHRQRGPVPTGVQP